MERLLPKSEDTRQSQMYAVRDIEEINIYSPTIAWFSLYKKDRRCKLLKQFASSVSLKNFYVNVFVNIIAWNF